MGIQFVKGWTNNHLTWAMVDATDFASPESALSAATKIKIYGKVKGATGTNFVSSGTGSLTNDIQHVGASALGIYTIALAKADLSDASAAWYDQYIISLSATGAAYQTLIVDGGIWISNLSAIASDILSDVSDMHSDIIMMSDALSDIVVLLASTGVHLNASTMSDIRSAIAGGPAATVTASDISDIASAVRALFVSDLSDILSAATQTNSRVLLVQSRLSDLDSRLVSDVSDILSVVRGSSDAISDLLSRVNSASFLSDIASHVWSAKYTALSAASSFGSLFERMASDVSDIDSMLTTMSGILSDTYSAALLIQSMASDAHSAATQANSRALVVQSMVSDVDSALTSRFSNLESLVGTTGVQVNASSMSDLRSAIAGITATISASDMSDLVSRVWAAKYDIHSVASSFGSLFEVMASGISDLDSRISSTPSTKSQLASATYALFSDFMSNVNSAFAGLSDAFSDTIVLLATTGVQLNASMLSDLRSAIAAGPAATVTASDISDIASAVWANTIGTRVDSRIRLIQSNASDAVSMLALISSDTSDLLSMAGTTGFQLNASSLSDLRSAIAAGPAATVTASDISDIVSAVWAYTLGNKTVTINASDMSDIRSAITAGGGGGGGTVTASDISDIASAVRAAIVSDLSDILSAAQQTNSRALVLQSMVSDVDSALTSRFSNLESLVTTTGVQVNASSLSDLRSAITAGGALTASQVKVQVVNALSVDTYPEPGQGAPAATAPLSTKIGHLYKLSRNKITQDATTLKVFADNGATVDQKATVSDDGNVYTRGELETGP